MDSGIYIYCLTTMQCPDFFESFSGFGGLFLHRQGNLCAVAKMVALDEFCGPEGDRRLADAEWVTPRAIDHGRVIAKVFRASPVLPVPFGTLFSSPRILGDFLELNADLINGFFEYAADCEEWGIKALLDREKLKCSLIESNMETSPVAVSPGLRYMHERRAEQRADQQSSAWLERNLEAAVDVLDNCALCSCERRILGDSMQPDGREEVLNLAALMRRDRVDEFHQHVEIINRKYADEGLALALTGPWPPYSFCPHLESPS